MSQPLPDVDPAWAGLPLIEDHIDILVKAAISPPVAEQVGVRSLTRIQDIIDHAPGIPQKTTMLGMLIPWSAPDGRVVPQIRLDIPMEFDDGTKIKYMSPKAEDMGPQPFGLIRQGTGEGGILIVEGAKQAMAMASCLPPELDIDIIAMQGCWGWAHADSHIAANRRTTVCLDADMSSNLDVYRAAKLFQENLETIGAIDVRFIRVPATGKAGVDDWLGNLPLEARTLAAENLIHRAKANLGKAPAANRTQRRLTSVPNPAAASPFFDADGKFLPQDAANLLTQEFPVGKQEGDDNPYAYTPTGVYSCGLAGILNNFCLRVGNDYMVSHKNSLADKLTAMAEEGVDLPYFLTSPLVNCRNGVINLDTLEFSEHSPDFPCTIQIPVDYDPEATCPVFDEFLERHAGDQAESLLEHCSTMLDHTKAPERAVMMYGDGGTGKSTFIKFMTKLAGGYASHQSLHAVSEDKFSQAQLHNKILNTCGDLSNKDINDPSQFKQVTGGGDPIEAQKKYGKHVKFQPRALFVFSMNQVPRVSENSNAFFRRVAPFRFNEKYPGPGRATVNEFIEQHEMEGVFLKLVNAAHNMRKRGSAKPPSPDVVKEYESKVCRVRGWYNDWCELAPQGVTTPNAELYAHFLQKAEVGAEKPMTMVSFSTRMNNIAGVKTDHRPYIMGKQVRSSNVIIKSEGNQPPEPEPEPTPASEEPVTTVTPTEPITTPEVPTPVIGKSVTLDLETGGVEDAFASTDPAYIRLVGISTDDENVDIRTEFTPGMLDGVEVTGQNVIAFDLAVLHHRGLYDLESVIQGEVEVYDTMIAARLSDPPPARQSPAAERGRYSLAGLAKRFDLPIDKDILKSLAKAYGGFDKIPQDNADYREYLARDVVTTAKVREKLGPLDDYAKREMRTAAIAAQMSSTGIRVDVPLLEKRLEAGKRKKEAALQRLSKEYGMPLDGASPHASAAGKSALKRAFQDVGIRRSDVTKTPKGEVSFGKDAMDKIIEQCAPHDEVVLTADYTQPTGVRRDTVHVPARPDLLELAELVKELNGIRTVYGTVAEHLKGDRVHPGVSMRQASGRWSITNPGLTVIGKRGENAAEREMFLPEPGHVFLSCDLAQVDARCVAALSECDGYREMFRPGVDLHTEVAKTIFGDADKRQLAKVVSHGWNYGASPNGIAFATGVEQQVAEEYDVMATSRFPGVVQWRKNLVSLTQQGIWLDNGWGRKLAGDPERARTQSPGLVGQSAARDIAVECLLRMEPEVRRCFRLWIHDEILLSVPEDHYEEYKAKVLEAMSFEWDGRRVYEAGSNRGIPFMGDSGVPGRNWSEVYGTKG